MGRKSKKLKSSEDGVLSRDAKKSIIAVIIIAVVIIFLLSLFGQAGVAGNYIDKNILGGAFGWGRYLLPLVLIYVAIKYYRSEDNKTFYLTTGGLSVAFFLFLGIIHTFYSIGEMQKAAADSIGGGYLGYFIASPTVQYFGSIGGAILLFALFLVSLVVAFNLPLHRIGELVPKFSKKEGDEEADSEEEEAFEYEDETAMADDNIRSIEFVEGPKEEFVPQVVNESVKEQRVLRANIYSGIDWKLPDYELLEKNEKKPKLGNLEENADIIKKTLHNFNIEVEKGEYNVGPTVTQYTFKPAVGVKLSKILALQNDLALALAAHPIRIEAPIPGKSLVGVEVPNRTKVMVRMRTMLESQEFQNRPSDLCITLGEDVNGNVIIGNIEKMPHLMIAGSTGTGKSVGINAVLTALLYQNSPEQLRLILVDPKRVELSLYNGIPHLLTPVIVENSKVVNALKWAVGEMERRYRLLQEAGSRDIHSYNEKIAVEMAKQEDVEADEEQELQMEKIPFIVIVIDELADLMAAHAREVEGLIVRLAQMARAVGIHLIVSTQRPSVEVITGLIKANITTRIAFQVATQIDSRTILDMGGAEKLLGNGDMLYLSADSAQPRRIQGVYISEKEVKKMVDFIKKQADEAEYTHGEDLSGSLEAQLENAMGTLAGSGTEGGKDDVLYEQAKKIAIETGKLSASFLQRKMRIGYSRASRLMDMLEEKGVIGPQDGSRPRQVLMKAGDTEYTDVAEDQAKRDKWQQ